MPKTLPTLDIPLDDYNEKKPQSLLKMWAGNQHKRIQHVLRTVASPEALYDTSPNTFIFLKRMYEYARSHGLSKEALIASKIKRLYRGDSRGITQIALPIEDCALIATSTKKSVASSFISKNDGTMFVFNVKTLPEDIRCISIDTSIDPIFHESEILLLPGVITPIITAANGMSTKSIKSTYEAHKEYQQAIVSKKTPPRQMYKGGCNELKHVMLKDGAYNKPLVELAGHTIVYWRAIYNRKAEVLNIITLPDKAEAARKWLQKNYRVIDHHYTNINEFIPEYKDLKEQYAQTQSKEAIGIMLTYDIYAALVNTKTNEILTVHYRNPASMFWCDYYTSRKDEILQLVSGSITPVAC